MICAEVPDRENATLLFCCILSTIQGKETQPRFRATSLSLFTFMHRRWKWHRKYICQSQRKVALGKPWSQGASAQRWQGVAIRERAQHAAAADHPFPATGYVRPRSAENAYWDRLDSQQAYVNWSAPERDVLAAALFIPFMTFLMPDWAKLALTFLEETRGMLGIRNPDHALQRLAL